MKPVPPAETGGGERPRRARRAAAFVLGVLMLGAAVVVVARSGDVLGRAWAAVSRQPPWLLALAVALPALNWLTTAGELWALTRMYGRVRAAEMNALVGSAWLLNYLPLRPGMIGRIAYHKALNAIRVRDSVKVLVWAIVCGAVTIAILAGALALTPAGAGAPTGVAVASAPMAGLGVAALATGGRARLVLIALTLRYADTLVWTGRYLLVFALLGSPIGPGAALVIATASQAALLVPLAGNGLGLREWAVGVTAAALGGVGGPPAGDQAAALGLAADLLNRAAEVAAAVPIGLACTVLVARAVGTMATTDRTTVV